MNEWTRLAKTYTNQGDFMILLIIFSILSFGSCSKTDQSTPAELLTNEEITRLERHKEDEERKKSEESKKKETLTKPKIPDHYKGQISRKTLNLPLIEKTKELTLLLTPQYFFTASWRSAGTQEVHQMADLLTGGGGRKVCDIELFDFKEYVKKSFITANIHTNHLDIYLDDRKIDYEDNAEWVDNSDHIKIVIQNFRGAKKLKIVNKTQKPIKARKEDASLCPDKTTLFIFDHQKPKDMPLSSYYHFSYAIE